MPSRLSVLLLLGAAPAAIAQVKPAALQLCVELPLGEPVFTSEPAPTLRALGKEWMVDFDVRVDGERVEKVTKVSASCLRAWVSPRKVKRVELDFSRLSNNFTSRGHDVAFELKSDLLYDAGKFLVEQEPFATVTADHPGTLVLERVTSQGLVREDPKQLPAGEYRVSFVPQAPPTAPCETRLEVTTLGSVTKERQPQLLAELTESYRADMLPEVLKKHRLTCAPTEVAVVKARLVDGVFAKPFEPAIERLHVSDREPRVELKHLGATQPLDQPVSVTIGPGQHLDVLTVVPTEAPVAETPELSAHR